MFVFKKMKKTTFLQVGMDLDISVFTNLKEGINTIKLGNSNKMIISLKNGKISFFRLEEKLIKEADVIVIDDEIEKVEETLSDDESISNVKKENTSSFMKNDENISFGSTELSGIVDTKPILINNEEIEPIITSLSSDDEEIENDENDEESMEEVIELNKSQNESTIISSQENFETQNINQDESQMIEEIKEGLSDDEQNELNLSLFEPKLFNFDKNNIEKNDELEEINDVISDEEDNIDKYFIKTISEISDGTNKTGYNLCFDLKEEMFYKLINFKKVDNFQDYNRYFNFKNNNKNPLEDYLLQ